MVAYTVAVSVHKADALAQTVTYPVAISISTAAGLGGGEQSLSASGPRTHSNRARANGAQTQGQYGSSASHQPFIHVVFLLVWFSLWGFTYNTSVRGKTIHFGRKNFYQREMSSSGCPPSRQKRFF